MAQSKGIFPVTEAQWHSCQFCAFKDSELALRSERLLVPAWRGMTSIRVEASHLQEEETQCYLSRYGKTERKAARECHISNSYSIDRRNVEKIPTVRHDRMTLPRQVSTLSTPVFWRTKRPLSRLAKLKALRRRFKSSQMDELSSRI